MNLTVENILNCTNGKLIIGDKSQQTTNFSKDTRTLQKGDTYIGIKGEKFDGCLFWKEAFDNGADIVIMNQLDLEKEKIEQYRIQNKCIIQVKDTILALEQMATYKRELYKNQLKVIGITGSVGKTSTKDMIEKVVSQKYKTLKTEGNNNNIIGLPLTILRLKDEEVAIIEMGMNHSGEIRRLAKIAKPDIAVITNVGTSHIGNLGSRENILKAKLEILEEMSPKVILINNDNDLLNKWNLEQKENIEIHTFGIQEKSEFQVKNIELYERTSQFVCKTQQEEIDICVPVGGEHFILNALCATGVGKLLNLDNEQIKTGIQNFKLSEKRMEILPLKNNIIVINDSYNASYESMKASILSLKNMNASRRIVVLGDMFELGEFSENLHRNVGIEIAQNSIDKLFLIGENVKYIAEEAMRHGYKKENIFYSKNKETLLDALKEQLQKGDVVLFKASNGMKLFEVVEDLKNW